MKTNKKTTTKVVATLIAIIIVVGILPVMAIANLTPTSTASLLTLDELRAEYGAITVEAYNIGQGFLLEPTLYVKEGKSAGDITVDLLTSKGLTFSGSTSYFSGFEFDDSIEVTFPEYLQYYLDMGEIFTENSDPDGMLAEFDYSYYAGWVYTINEWWASWGAADAYPGQEITDYNTQEQVVLGDVIRWHFTVYGYGADCGFPSNVMAEYMGGNLFTQEDKSNLLFTLAAINDYYGNLDTDEVYETALDVAANPVATAEEIATQEATLTTYIENTFFETEEATPIEKAIQSTGLSTTVVEGVVSAVIIPTPHGNIAMTEEELLAMFGENTSVEITSNNGKVGTGSKITLDEEVVEIVIKGDIDGDGITSVFDALLAKKSMNENISEIDELREFAGDVDGNTGISDNDVDKLLSHIVGESYID